MRTPWSELKFSSSSFTSSSMLGFGGVRLGLVCSEEGRLPVNPSVCVRGALLCELLLLMFRCTFISYRWILKYNLFYKSTGSIIFRHVELSASKIYLVTHFLPPLTVVVRLSPCPTSPALNSKQITLLCAVVN